MKFNIQFGCFQHCKKKVTEVAAKNTMMHRYTIAHAKAKFIIHKIETPGATEYRKEDWESMYSHRIQQIGKNQNKKFTLDPEVIKYGTVMITSLNIFHD